jgi:hypothetical protein
VSYPNAGPDPKRDSNTTLGVQVPYGTAAGSYSLSVARDGISALTPIVAVTVKARVLTLHKAEPDEVLPGATLKISGDGLFDAAELLASGSAKATATGPTIVLDDGHSASIPCPLLDIAQASDTQATVTVPNTVPPGSYVVVMTRGTVTVQTTSKVTVLAPPAAGAAPAAGAGATGAPVQ